MKTDMERRLAIRNQRIPERGFNLVEVDSFASDIEDELNIIGNYDTRAEAEVEMAKRKADAVRRGQAVETFHIYAPEDQ